MLRQVFILTQSRHLTLLVSMSEVERFCGARRVVVESNKSWKRRRRKFWFLQIVKSHIHPKIGWGLLFSQGHATFSRLQSVYQLFLQIHFLCTNSFRRYTKCVPTFFAGTQKCVPTIFAGTQCLSQVHWVYENLLKKKHWFFTHNLSFVVGYFSCTFCDQVKVRIRNCSTWNDRFEVQSKIRKSFFITRHKENLPGPGWNTKKKSLFIDFWLEMTLQITWEGVKAPKKCENNASWSSFCAKLCEICYF